MPCSLSCHACIRCAAVFKDDSESSGVLKDGGGGALASRRAASADCSRRPSDLLPIGRTSRRLVESVFRGRTDIKKSRFTDEQIIGFLKQAEGGMPVKELCRLSGFSDATFDGAPMVWKSSAIRVKP